MTPNPNVKFINSTQKLFKILLGVDVEVSSSVDANDEAVFVQIVSSLTEAAEREQKLFRTFGLNTTAYTNTLWEVVELLLESVYGNEIQDMILWYIFDRINPDGVIEPVVGNKGEKIYIKNVRQLWHYTQNHLNHGDKNDTV